MQRVLDYAHERDYTKYTSTLFSMMFSPILRSALRSRGGVWKRARC